MSHFTALGNYVYPRSGEVLTPKAGGHETNAVGGRDQDKKVGPITTGLAALAAFGIASAAANHLTNRPKAGQAFISRPNYHASSFSSRPTFSSQSAFSSRPNYAAQPHVLTPYPAHTVYAPTTPVYSPGYSPSGHFIPVSPFGRTISSSEDNDKETPPEIGEKNAFVDFDRLGFHPYFFVLAAQPNIVDHDKTDKAEKPEEMLEQESNEKASEEFGLEAKILSDISKDISPDEERVESAASGEQTLSPKAMVTENLKSRELDHEDNFEPDYPTIPEEYTEQDLEEENTPPAYEDIAEEEGILVEEHEPLEEETHIADEEADLERKKRSVPEAAEDLGRKKKKKLRPAAAAAIGAIVGAGLANYATGSRYPQQVVYSNGYPSTVYQPSGYPTTAAYVSPNPHYVFSTPQYHTSQLVSSPNYHYPVQSYPGAYSSPYPTVSTPHVLTYTQLGRTQQVKRNIFPFILLSYDHSPQPQSSPSYYYLPKRPLK